MRRLIVVILAFLTLAVAAPAGAANMGPLLQQAQDVEPAEEEERVPVEEVEEPAEEGEEQVFQEPAVVIEEDEGEAEEIAWTFRFLVPTLWLLTALLVVGTVFAHRRRLQKKFQVTGQ